MQIKIEIDVKPEELRRFLGLPDVAGLQEDLINFLREKVGAASESFDPTSFVKDNLQTLKQSAPWQLLVSAAKGSPKTPEAAKPARKASGSSGSVAGKIRKRPAAKVTKPKAGKTAASE